MGSKRFYRFVMVLSIISVPGSYSGVISDLPEEQIKTILALYRKSCGEGRPGARVSSSASRPNVNILCREPKEYVSPEDRKIIRIPAQRITNRTNIIFVEVPATHFKHDITLLQKPENQPKKIYVLPQKSSHEILLQDQRYGAGLVRKPEVFFLKTGNNLDGFYGNAEYGPPSAYFPPQLEQQLPSNKHEQYIFGGAPFSPRALPKMPARYVLPPPHPLEGI